MADSGTRERDPALAALAGLTEVVASSASELTHVGDELTTMGRRRRRGWSWRRIVGASDSGNPLSAVLRIVSDLASASGSLRRALARALRNEGMQTGQVATHFGVSRQRVSALLHSRSDKDQD